MKPSIGIFTDWRIRYEGKEIVNLMISCSLDQIVQSLDELVSALKDLGFYTKSTDIRKIEEIFDEILKE